MEDGDGEVKLGDMLLMRGVLLITTRPLLLPEIAWQGVPNSVVIPSFSGMDGWFMTDGSGRTNDGV